MGNEPGKNEPLIPEVNGLNLDNPNKELAKNLGKKLLTLMVIGRSGAGKSTWINTFISHFSGRSYHDERLVAIDQTFTNDTGPFKQKCNITEFTFLQTEKGDSQAKAQTTSCTLYRIVTSEHLICIMDTPGLDEIGEEADSKHLKQIGEYALMVGEINTIIYVHKADDVRVNQSLKNIIGRYLSMLSSDVVQQKLIVCFTHVSNLLKKTIPAIDTLKILGIMHDMPQTKYFAFKNDNWLHKSLNADLKGLSESDQSELLASEEKDWNRNQNTFREFMKHLELMHEPASTESIFLAGKKDEGSRKLIAEVLKSVAQGSAELKAHRTKIAHLTMMMDLLDGELAKKLTLGYLSDGIFHPIFKLETQSTALVYSIHKKAICHSTTANDIALGLFGSGDTELACCKGKKSQHVAIYSRLQNLKRIDRKLEEVNVKDLNYLAFNFNPSGYDNEPDYIRLIQLYLFNLHQEEQARARLLRDSMAFKIKDGISLKNRKETTADILELLRKQDPALYGELGAELESHKSVGLSSDCIVFLRMFAKGERYTLNQNRDRVLKKFKPHTIVSAEQMM